MKMHFLNEAEYLHLNQYVIELLAKHRIVSVLDFMKEDPNKLTKICNLSYPDVMMTRKFLTEKFGVTPVNGLQIYQNRTAQMMVAETGIQSFDSLLEGGLINGHLYEFCGLSTTGKTQICHTIAICLSQKYNLETFYIDTKNDFSGTRIHHILKARKLDTDKIGIMNCIKCERVYDAYELIEMLKTIIQSFKIGTFSNLKMIIFDSLPSIWYQWHGEHFKDGIRLLAELTNLLRKIATEYQIIVLLVNLATRWNDFELGESKSMIEESKLIPALGKYWQSVPSTRFLMKKSTIESEITIEILKSNQYKTGANCKVTITDKGVV